MTAPLAGQVAIIVGASSGMGRATAMSLANGGAKVVLAARRAERLEDLRTEIESAGGTALVTATDVAQRAEVDQLIETTLAAFSRIDLLVYATGTNLPDRSLTKLTPANWDMMVATNLTGAFHCTQAVLPTMRAAGNGLIVYLSSAAVQMPDVSGVAYQATKHGLTGLAHGTRIEEKPNGVRTSVIYPGLCDTEILTKRPTPTPREVLDKSLHPEDVAAAVRFLAELPSRAVVPELQLFPSQL